VVGSVLRPRRIVPPLGPLTFLQKLAAYFLKQKATCLAGEQVPVMRDERDIEALKAEWVSLETMLADLEPGKIPHGLAAIPSMIATAEPLFGIGSKKSNRHFEVGVPAPGLNAGSRTAVRFPTRWKRTAFSPALFKLAHYRMAGRGGAHGHSGGGGSRGAGRTRDDGRVSAQGVATCHVKPTLTLVRGLETKQESRRKRTSRPRHASNLRALNEDGH
jgi:hypothetical protein